MGIPAVLQKRSLDLRSHYQSALSLSCFSAAARHEVMLDEKKLVGSAQRRLPQGVLQHGSLLTGNAHSALPEYLEGVEAKECDRMRRIIEKKTISIGGYIGKSVDYGEIVDAIREGMEEALSIKFKEEELTFEENERIITLCRNFSIFSGRMVPLPEDGINH